MVTNAKVYTVDPDQPWADAFAFDINGVIVAVGSESEVLAATGDDPERIDAAGDMVLAGLQDPHVHVPEAGINADLCFMTGRNLESLESQARDCARLQSDSEWVRAVGPSLFDLRTTEELPIEVLDRVHGEWPLRRRPDLCI